jgi:hypothetical protein
MTTLIAGRRRSIALLQSDLKALVGVTRHIARQTSQVEIQIGPSGTRLTIRTELVDVSLESQSAAGRAWCIAVRLGDLSAFQSDPRTEIRLTRRGPNLAAVRWTEDGIQKEGELPVQELEPPEILEASETSSYQSDVLLDALRDAAGVMSPRPGRIALDCVLLSRRWRRLAATDGIHLFSQSGFEFPWEGDRLIHGGGVYRARVLQKESSASAAEQGGRIVVRVGRWTMSHRLETERRFLDLDLVAPRWDAARSRAVFEEEDVQFLLRHLATLPCDDPINTPVTLDLSREVVVRGRAEDHCATELALARSSRSGPPVSIDVNRVSLERVLSLAFREIGVIGLNNPVIAIDGLRTFVWMSLGPERGDAPLRRIDRLTSTSES